MSLIHGRRRFLELNTTVFVNAVVAYGKERLLVRCCMGNGKMLLQYTTPKKMPQDQLEDLPLIILYRCTHLVMNTSVTVRAKQGETPRMFITGNLGPVPAPDRHRFT